LDRHLACNHQDRHPRPRRNGAPLLSRSREHSFQTVTIVAANGDELTRQHQRHWLWQRRHRGRAGRHLQHHRRNRSLRGGHRHGKFGRCFHRHIAVQQLDRDDQLLTLPSQRAGPIPGSSRRGPSVSFVRDPSTQHCSTRSRRFEPLVVRPMTPGSHGTTDAGRLGVMTGDVVPER
jgi:hypothetical protein